MTVNHKTANAEVSASLKDFRQGTSDVKGEYPQVKSDKTKRMKLNFSLIIAVIFLYSIECFASPFFVSPNGTSFGNGSILNPWDFQTALNQPISVLPGDTIWLRGGTYTGHFISHLNGALNQYIYVLPYPNEQVKIEDNRQYASGATLQVNGSWTVYKGFEITNSNPNRTSVNASSFRPMGMQVVAPHTKCINLIIHDVGHGIGFWKEATDSEIYGCLIYNCGTANSPGVYSTHGHGIYSQNDTGIKIIRENIVFNQFGFGLHIYPNPGNVNGYMIDGNTFFNNGLLTHDTVRYNNIIINPYPPYTANDIIIQNNLTYDSKSSYTYTALIESDVLIGSTNVQCSGLKMQNNYFMGKGRAGVAILQWDSVFYQQNTSYYLQNGSAAIVLPPQGSYSNNRWDNNAYYGSTFPLQFSYQYSPLVHFSNWQSTTGFDANSSYLNSSPDSTQIFIYPNRYESGRANLIIYNWNLLPMVPVDLSASGLSNGQHFTIVDAQNYFGIPLYSGVFNDINPMVAIDVTDLVPVAPHGMPGVPGTSPEFATLVIVPGPQPNSTLASVSDPVYWKIYPVPADEIVHIEVTFSRPTPIRLELFDFFGNKQYEKETTLAEEYKGQINTSALQAGVYVLKLTSAMGTSVKRIVVI